MPRYELRQGDKYFFINGEFNVNNLKEENAFTVDKIVKLHDNGVIYSDGGQLLADDWDKVWVLRDNGHVQQLRQVA